ncbi:MAG: peptidase caspase catalytic subunit p20 [Proteobacteria bacterium]|jgi:hypothetical protein|nr:peptidase caspase catalytic subunit p20 [Pseudomonadota bacterium]
MRRGRLRHPAIARFWLALLATALLLALPPHARAERHALLVGVSRYAVFAGDERWQLAGPANDVQLMRTLLERRGFAGPAVRVLADGVPDAAAPTRAAILEALDDLAARVAPGDQVALYFAGHGSQMPADPQTPQGRAENDGLHEIFLPADTGRWNPQTRRVDRAIADHELVERLDALTGRGAFVFAVFDTCHSATSLRAVPGAATRWRRVEPEALGITATSRVPAPTSLPLPGLARTSQPKSGTGGFVAFYAAQTSELTPEMPLPAGRDGSVHGLFTYTLAEALASASVASYRQLAQFVFARYAAQNLSTPTPLVTGTGLDAPVFGDAAGPAPRQWPLRVTPAGLRVEAGRLDGLDVGSELDILPDALAPAGARLGSLRVASATATSALLLPVEAGGRAAIDAARLPPQAVARHNGPARLALQLRVAAPTVAPDSASRAVWQAIDAMTRRPEGVDIAWVGPEEPHDLRLQVALGRLWLLPSTGHWLTEGVNATPSLAIGEPALAERLHAQLQRVGRSLNLLRIAGSAQGAPSDRRVQVQATLLPTQGSRRSIEEWQIADVHDGDHVAVEVRNTGRQAVDLTALYVDAAHGITVLYPNPRGASNRIEAGDRDSFVARIDASTRGVERLLLITVDAQPQGDRRDFSFLAQPRLGAMRGATDAVSQLFQRAAFGSTTGAGRRGAERQATEPLDMRVFSLDVR